MTAYSIKIMFFLNLTFRVALTGDESNKFKAQVLSPETASIQQLNQAFSENIDLNQLMT